MESLKFDLFEGQSDEDIFGQFFNYIYDDEYNRVPLISEEDAEFLRGAKILIAGYSYEDYSGRAFVLYEKDGQLYELNGSHCSCHGLEGQFSKKETDIDSLLKRDYIYSYEYDYSNYTHRRSHEDQLIIDFLKEIKNEY